jgi:DNA-directed RNA polymerase subunit beta
VKEGVVDLSNEGVKYLSAEEEEETIIAQANAPLDDKGNFVRSRVKTRLEADYPVVGPEEVYI